MAVTPWGAAPVDLERFREPPRAYGILPFWFLNGELDPDEMRRQIREFRDKGMPGIVLHGRYGLETPYIGDTVGGRRVRLEPVLVDDVLEVVVNGHPAGVRLWPPYGLDVTPLLQPGQNELELWVSNTAANLFGGTPRPSGLAGAPTLVPEVDVDLDLVG